MSLRYVALGDSYTIGTSLGNPAGRWPYQLVAALRIDGSAGDGLLRRDLELVANLGVNGYTTADVIRDELPALEALRPEFASLLIGVNDVVQGVTLPRYQARAAEVLDALSAQLAPNRIVTVSTPDYTVTPQGTAYGEPAVQAAAIRAANRILAGLAASRGIAFVDIHDLSLRAAVDPSLVADDGLHPSAAQYALWVARIATVVRALLDGPPAGPPPDPG